MASSGLRICEFSHIILKLLLHMGHCSLKKSQQYLCWENLSFFSDIPEHQEMVKKLRAAHFFKISCTLLLWKLFRKKFYSLHS